MIGTILEVSRRITAIGRPALRLKVDVDGDIAFGFISLDTGYEHLGLVEVLNFCCIDEAQSSYYITNQFIGKIIPMTKVQFRDKMLWSIDWIQIRKKNRDDRNH